MEYSDLKFFINKKILIVKNTNKQNKRWIFKK